jgi:type IV secretion system protein VirB9
VKPRACDVTTNLVVPTDRRIYDLTLDSPPCPRGSLNPRLGRRAARALLLPGRRADRSAPGASPLAPLASAGRPAEVRPADALSTIEAEAVRGGRGVNRGYRVVRKRRGPFGLFGRKPVDFPWQPAGIVDDGARTFVALPINAAPHAAPVLYAIEDDGSRTMVNYAVRTVAGAPGVRRRPRCEARCPGGDGGLARAKAGDREPRLGKAIAQTRAVSVRQPVRGESDRREARGG